MKIIDQCCVFILLSLIVIHGYAGVNTSRPDSTEPTDVRIQIFVIDIKEINSAEQQFSANLFYHVQWHDPRLANKHQQQTSYDLDQVWNPNIQIVNQQRIFKTLPEVITVDKDGNASYKQRVWGAFSEPMHLHQFPFDKQSLNIDFVAAGYRPDTVKFHIDSNNPSGIADKFTLPDWTILDWATMDKQFIPMKNIPPIHNIRFQILAQRDIGYYVFMFIFPLTLIVMMSWITFWIDPKDVNPRISVSISSMLTIIAYRFIVGNSLPKVSYLTQLDLFILGSTVLVFLTIIVNGFTTVYMRQQRDDEALAVNRIARWLFPLIFFSMLTTITLFGLTERPVY